MAGKFHQEVSELAEFLPIATERETVAINALLEHSSGPAAAAACGLSLSVLHQRLTSVRRRAQRNAGVTGLPGMYPRQVTTNADGAVTAVQHRRESLAPDEPIPPGHTVKGISQLVDSEGRELLRWTKTDRKKQDEWNAFVQATELHVRRYAGLAAPVAAPESTDADTETWIPIGDPHLGLLAHRAEVGTDADLRIAERVLYETVDLLIARAPASAVGVFCQLGDMFHSDSNANRTMSGHQLDVDSRHAKVAEVGFNLARRLGERMLTKFGRVLMINAPGNHAPNTEKMMALWLKAVFEREPRVEVIPSTNPYIYHRFGTNLIGVHHGDGAKMMALGEIMAADRPEDWGATTHRAWLTGHIHHDSRKDLRGCTVESFRTMASADAWSHHAGYRSGRSLQAITYHREWGEQGRVTVGIREIEARSV